MIQYVRYLFKPKTLFRALFFIGIGIILLSKSISMASSLYGTGIRWSLVGLAGWASFLKPIRKHTWDKIFSSKELW
jgi:hypothetical protein